MDYYTAFAISGSGMAAEKLRLDVTAVNIANANSSRGADGTLYRPLSVVTSMRVDPSFESVMRAYGAPLGGVQVDEIRPTDTPPRVLYEPGHPDADDRGYVTVPGINPVTEMVNLIVATRSYQANVVVLNAAKFMAQRALEIGGTR